MGTRRIFAVLLGYAWAAPYSLLGLLFGLTAVLLGARAHLHEGVIEFGLSAGRSRLRAPFGFSAITFGHVILGIDEATLAAVRAHEQVHVRQYERWGPFLVPAYLFAALWAVLRRRHPYRDNHFEVAARAEVSGGGSLIR
jgi:hypothetical protein